MKTHMPEKTRPLKTREILAATGITHQILYRYVTMGLVEELQTRGGGQRRFPAATIAIIKLIQSLNQSGYTLRDIKDIFFRDERRRKLGRRRQRRNQGES